MLTYVDPLKFVHFQKDNEPKPIVLRKRRQRIKSEANWKLFYYHFNRDHSKANLIWNFKVKVVFTFAIEFKR